MSVKRYKQRDLPNNLFYWEVITKQSAPVTLQQFKVLVGNCCIETGVELNLEESHVYVVIHKESALPIAFVAVERAFAGKDIKMVFVRKDFRRQGIGAFLVEQVVLFGVFHDTTFALVDENNTVTHEFLESIGFTVISDKAWGTTASGKFYRMTGMDLNRLREWEEDRAIIQESKNWVDWDGPQEVTLDGHFDLKELKALVRFIENGGPGDKTCKHEEL